MKKVVNIILFGITCLFIYNVFLILFPSKMPAYVNRARVENFIYAKKDFPIVLAGSSLSGVFEEPKAKEIFGNDYFNMYLPYSGACTGVEVLRLSKKTPKILFVEINQVHRGTDSDMVKGIFESPIYSYKGLLPFTLAKNKFVSNMIDRFKKPPLNQGSKKQPAAVLYNNLLKRMQKTYGKIEDKKHLDSEIAKLSNTLKEFASNGCQIYLYEMPMDSSLRYSKVLVYERTYFENFAKQNNFHFIPADTSRAYKTGDGDHLLEGERMIYLDYLKKQGPNFNNAQQSKADLIH